MDWKSQLSEILDLNLSMQIQRSDMIPKDLALDVAWMGFRHPTLPIPF